MKNQEIAWLLKEKYRGVESKAFHADCERLAAGEPLAYVIGHVPFLGSTIYLDSKPLIPRPETEFWAEKAIAAIRTVMESGAAAKPPRVLDLCAGSGAIGVAVTNALSSTHITFAELDPAHLPTIQKNLTENAIIYDSERNQRTTVIQSDLLAKIEGIFDFILCNPPYIDAAAHTVDESVATNEPHLALFGGENGMEIIERIIAGARASLAPAHGQLWLEHEPFQTAAILQLAHQHGFIVTTHLDQYGTARYSVLTYPVAK